MAINENGEILKPLIVFKGKYNSTKQNRLNKNLQNLHVSKKEIYVIYKDNSGVTKKIFEFLLTNNIFPYRRFINNSYKLLIMDRAYT